MTPAMTRRLYVTAWLMLGAIALVYFFTLFQSFRGPTQTSTLTTGSTPTLFAKKTPAPADPAVSKALERMRDEIDRLKGSLEAVNKENTALKAHIGTLEATFGQSTTAALPREAMPMEASEKKEEKTARSTPAPKVEITMMAMPVDGFAGDDFQGSPLPISGQGKPTRTLFGVELAKGLKRDEVAKQWKWLKIRHKKLLGGLKPRRVTVLPGSGSNEGGTTTLIAGPFSNAAAAARLCARLIAAGAKCKGTIFAGSPVGGVASR